MAKSKEQKKEILGQYEDNLDNYQNIVLIDIKSVKTSSVETFKNKLAEEGSKYFLLKNTLFQKAFKEKKQGIEIPELDGPTGIVFIKQESAKPIKEIMAFLNENSTSAIKVGIIEGQAYDSAKVIEISKLPSKQEMLAKTVGTIKTPLFSLINSLSGVQRKFLYTLKAIETKKQ